METTHAFIETNLVKTRAHFESELQKLNERTDKNLATINGYDQLIKSLQKSSTEEAEKLSNYKKSNAETFKYIHQQEERLKTITE